MTTTKQPLVRRQLSAAPPETTDRRLSRVRSLPLKQLPTPTTTEINEQTTRFLKRDVPREFSDGSVPASLRRTFGLLLAELRQGMSLVEEPHEFRLCPETGKPIYPPLRSEALSRPDVLHSYSLNIDLLRMKAAKFASFFQEAVRVNLVSRPSSGRKYNKFRYDFGDHAIPADKLICKYWLCDGDEVSPVFERLCERFIGPTLESLPDLQTEIFELRRVIEHFALELIRCLYIGTEQSLFGWFTQLSETSGRYTFFTRLAFPDFSQTWTPNPDSNALPARALHTHDVVSMNIHQWPGESVHYPMWIYDLLRRASDMPNRLLKIVDGDLARQSIVVRHPELPTHPHWCPYEPKQESELPRLVPTSTLNTEHQLDFPIDEDEPPYEPCILFGDVVLCGWAEEDLEPNPDGLPIRHDRGYEVLFDDGKQTRYKPPGGRQREKPRQPKQKKNSRPSFDFNNRFSGGRFPDIPRR